MRVPASELIEQVVANKQNVKTIVEIITKTDSGGGTKIVPDDSAKGREIVEKHFQAMTAELEQAGIKGFNASVDDTYARISFGNGCY